jgi:uncharacterized protein (DUF885 family)
VLVQGALPLTILESNIDEWLKQQKSGAAN